VEASPAKVITRKFKSMLEPLAPGVGESDGEGEHSQGEEGEPMGDEPVAAVITAMQGGAIYEND
jgi:hypothetical protein